MEINQSYESQGVSESSSSESSSSESSSSESSSSERSLSNKWKNSTGSQLTPISAAIQKSFYNTKMEINKAHLDYLNRIMEAKASLACELKNDWNQKQQESMDEIKRFVGNEQNALKERMERCASPQHCYCAIQEHVENLQDFVASLMARKAEETEKSKINIMEKHKQLIQSNQYKLQDLHGRFIVPLRNGIQCVSTNQHLPNVGDTIEFNDGVFNEKFGKYKQYIMEDYIHECGDGDNNGIESVFNSQLKDDNSDENHISFGGKPLKTDQPMSNSNK